MQALAFRKASANATTPVQLYTGSFDRNVNIYDLSVMGYVETMFGHETPVVSMDALMRETAVSAGGRDKSVRLWKVQDSTHLVFRAGGRSRWEDVLEESAEGDGDGDGVDGVPKKTKGKKREEFVEGSVECVAMVDEGTFLSGGDSGYVYVSFRFVPSFVTFASRPASRGLSEHPGLILTPFLFYSIS